MEVFWFIVALVLAGVLVFLLSKKTREEVVGICNFALEQSVHKQRNLDSILKLFEGKKELSNEEIRVSLKVSPRSVVRYMDELERQGKVKQVGTIGRGVAYTLASE